jgi:hypothetical protein
MKRLFVELKDAYCIAKNSGEKLARRYMYTDLQCMKNDFDKIEPPRPENDVKWDSKTHS